MMECSILICSTYSCKILTDSTYNSKSSCLLARLASKIDSESGQARYTVEVCLQEGGSALPAKIETSVWSHCDLKSKFRMYWFKLVKSHILLATEITMAQMWPSWDISVFLKLDKTQLILWPAVCHRASHVLMSQVFHWKHRLVKPLIHEVRVLFCYGFYILHFWL